VFPDDLGHAGQVALDGGQHRQLVVVARFPGAHHGGGEAQVLEEPVGQHPLRRRNCRDEPFTCLEPIPQRRLEVRPIRPAPMLLDELNLVMRDEQTAEDEASRDHPVKLALAQSDEQLRHAGGHGAGDSACQ
jgi:hypothetical protein